MGIPTRESVLATAGEQFGRDQLAGVVGILDEYRAEAYERERERVQMAILTLAQGDVDRLLHFTHVAKRDYRDVLYWAEFPDEGGAA